MLHLMPSRSWAKGSSSQDPQQQFHAAERAYQQGQYRKVVRLLRPLLYPTNRLSSQDKQIKAHKMLGIAQVFEKNQAEAEQSFLAILAERPSYRLDPLIDPPAAVELFESVTRRNAEELERIARQQREQQLRELREQQKRDAAAQVSVERIVTQHPYWINFLPFGAGQFQNGHRRKGFTLLVAQALLGTLSLGSALALRVTYPDNRPPSDELSTARTVNIMTVVSGGLFWGLVFYGILDALYYHTPRTVETHTLVPKSKVTLMPAPQPSGGGIGLSVRF